MTPPVVRQLAKLSESAAAAIVETFAGIAASPHRIGKPLRFELQGLWSVRRGPYRVIYRIEEAEHTIYVVNIGHRSDVYRKR